MTGVWYEESDDAYVRFDLPTRESTGEDVAYLGQHNAGGQLRFRTNSPEIALRVELRQAEFLPHMPLTGVSGMDVYAGTRCGLPLYRQRQAGGPPRYSV